MRSEDMQADMELLNSYWWSDMEDKQDHHHLEEDMDYLTEEQEDMELLQLLVDMVSAEYLLHIHIAAFEVVEEQEGVVALLMQKLEVCHCMINQSYYFHLVCCLYKDICLFNNLCFNH